jgi:hypothetical protein
MYWLSRTADPLDFPWLRNFSYNFSTFVPTGIVTASYTAKLICRIHKEGARAWQPPDATQNDAIFESTLVSFYDNLGTTSVQAQRSLQTVDTQQSAISDRTASHFVNRMTYTARHSPGT